METTRTHDAWRGRAPWLAGQVLIPVLASVVALAPPPSWAQQTHRVPQEEPAPPREPAPKDPAPAVPAPSGGGYRSRTPIGLSLSLGGGGGCRQPDPVKELSKNGPQLRTIYSMSQLEIEGLIRGGWPMALHYELEAGALGLLTVRAEGVDPFYYRLSGGGPKQEKIFIPARFGTEPQAAVFSLQALTDNAGAVQPTWLKVHGLGLGERSVGSLNIDELGFDRDRIKKKEKVTYGFRYREVFNDVEAHFVRMGRDGDQIVSQLVSTKKLGATNKPPNRLAKEWNGKNESGKYSEGLHALSVRAWRGAKNGGDWIVAWSDGVLEIE